VGLFVHDYDNDKNDKKTETIPDSVLTVGRLEEKKGYRYALEAIAIVKETIPSIQYYIIGEGTLRAELVRYAEELGVSDCCHFLGAQDADTVRAYYQTRAAFMLASVTAANGDMEGQALVLQEAQASGLPVVSTLHNGIPEGVIPDETGFLVPEKDSAALAEKLIVLLRDAPLRERMGEAGRRFIAGKYDMARVVARLHDLYRSALAG
jgi:colanic acid/amylovoran biosynthesis glycosyltransferase